MGADGTLRPMDASISAAAERNKDPILEVLARELTDTHAVLEIGSGTGQHAIHFATHLPRIRWQATDTAEYLPALRERIRRAALVNLPEPLELDVRVRPWPRVAVDTLYTANTLHIMSWRSVELLFEGLGPVLQTPGTLCIYGPFRYANRFTTASNAAFDEFLRQRDPESGIRDFEAVDALARRSGLALTADHAMPANNQLLIWRSRAR